MESPVNTSAGEGVTGGLPLTPEMAEATPPAWEQIEAGRFMPRRIRGSCRGRELG
jgi:hypothetical protein